MIEMRRLLSLSFAVVATVALARCASTVGKTGGSVLPAAASAQPHSASGYRILYRFRGGKDGSIPWGGLIARNGLLYGTTTQGGGNGCGGGGCGTVFSIDSTANEHVIYRFTGGNHGSGTDDGAGPIGTLVYRRGWFYGMTDVGGGGTPCYNSSCGTIFAVSPAGQERILYRFPGGKGGAFPFAGLVKADNGQLYGMTNYGGSGNCPTYGNACGLVFGTGTTPGTEHVLHYFRPGVEGYGPFDTLLFLRKPRLLFGTVSYGVGSMRYRQGIVFSMTLDGTEKVLHQFNGPSDGGDPNGGLVFVRGELYGTTLLGGSSSGNGWGTVFAVTLAGVERVVYRFRGYSDGQSPAGSLIWVRPKLYGTTAGGGGAAACTEGCGTVFSVTRSGNEQILHAFQGGSDGEGPGSATLLMSNGILYGVTAAGGGKGCGGSGCGTVFALTPGS